MDVQVVEKVIAAFNEAGLTSLALKCETFELKMDKKVGESTASQAMRSNTSSRTLLTQCIEEKEIQKERKYIKAPMVGTFYAASDPKAQPMVQVGTYIHKGDGVCIIEAMKLMNEVEAEVEGEIVEILVQNEEMVEYGQPLFVLK